MRERRGLGGSGELLLEAEAGGISDVWAEGWDAGVAAGFVEMLGVWLADAGFEQDCFVSESARVTFEGGDDEASEALAARGGDDIHALDFGAIVIERTQGAACDGVAIAARDEEDAFFDDGFGQGEWTGRAAVTFGHFGAERVDQLARGGTDRIFDGNGD